MESAAHILIVDDDAEIRQLLSEYLRREGYHTRTLPDGRGLGDAVSQYRTDLLILDLMLPGEDGLTLCRNLRAHSQVPVIMLTARGEETDRIIGLEMGADDYLPKPFSPRELLARIKAVLRRSRALPQSPDDGPLTRLCFNGWQLDLSARQLLTPDKVIVALSGGEFRLLKVFLEHPNRVLSRDQLLDLTRGREAIPFDRSIDVQVGRLRKRLGDDGQTPTLIKTVRGEGYVLATSVTTEGSCD
jgi:two-component system OmpR family response regulator